jgi:hypothetical protein
MPAGQIFERAIRLAIAAAGTVIVLLLMRALLPNLGDRPIGSLTLGDLSASIVVALIGVGLMYVMGVIGFGNSEEQQKAKLQRAIRIQALTNVEERRPEVMYRVIFPQQWSPGKQKVGPSNYASALQRIYETARSNEGKISNKTARLICIDEGCPECYEHLIFRGRVLQPVD